MPKYALIAVLCGSAIAGGAYARPWHIQIASAVKAAIHMPIISQRGKFFSPAEVGYAVGSTIRIDNDDNVAHSLLLTMPDGEVENLGTKEPGIYTDITMKQLGDYMARCGIHPRMKLVIHVR